MTTHSSSFYPFPNPIFLSFTLFDIPATLDFKISPSSRSIDCPFPGLAHCLFAVVNVPMILWRRDSSALFKAESCQIASHHNVEKKEEKRQLEDDFIGLQRVDFL
jgi:hypothetical protein